MTGIVGPDVRSLDAAGQQGATRGSKALRAPLTARHRVVVPSYYLDPALGGRARRVDTGAMVSKAKVQADPAWSLVDPPHAAEASEAPPPPAEASEAPTPESRAPDEPGPQGPPAEPQPHPPSIVSAGGDLAAEIGKATGPLEPPADAEELEPPATDPAPSSPDSVSESNARAEPPGGVEELEPPDAPDVEPPSEGLARPEPWTVEPGEAAKLGARFVAAAIPRYFTPRGRQPVPLSEGEMRAIAQGFQACSDRYMPSIQVNHQEAYFLAAALTLPAVLRLTVVLGDEIEDAEHENAPDDAPPPDPGPSNGAGSESTFRRRPWRPPGAR